MTLSPRRGAVAAAVLFTALLTAQDPKPEPAPPPEWPKLTKSEEQTAKKRGFERLGADEPEERAAADQCLVDLGAGVATLCIRQLRLSTLEHEDVINRVLDVVVAPEYLPLVVEVSDDTKAPVRRFAARWLARQVDPQATTVLRARAADKEKDDATRFSARLGLLALGDATHLDALLTELGEDWNAHADEVRATLTPARGDAAAEPVLAKLRNSDELTTIAALRMLRYAAPPSAAPFLAVHLDASKHAVKKAAINALRVSVDGDEPLEKLSVFQAIDAAKKWQERLR